MARPFYSEPLSVVGDGDILSVIGAPAGPAGAVSLELANGDEWLVDLADPANMVSIETRAGQFLSPLMVAAYGGDEALFLQDGADQTGDEGFTWHFGLDRRPGPIRYGPRSARQIDLAAARRAGTFVVLADMVDDQHLHPLSRLAALLTFALQLRRSSLSKALWEFMGPMQQQVVALSVLFDEHDLSLMTDDVIGDLLGLCDHAAETDPGWHRAVGDLGDQLRDHQDPPAIAAMRLEPEVRRESAVAHSLHSEPADAAQAETERESTVVQWQEPGVLNVSLHRDEADRWVRIRGRAGLVLLGQAPLRRDGLMDTAQILVPADLSEDELVVEVAGSEELERTVRGPAEAIRAAVRVGRDAARAQRIGMTEAAGERWLRCAEMWRAAGDPVRQSQALELAQHRPGGPAVQTSVADRVEESFRSG